MKTLGVILARAGSNGLRNKHTLDLLGRPVVAYTFDHAREATRLAQVLVSSDCPHVLRLARLAGLHTIVRPAPLATADASVQAAMLHAMHAHERETSLKFDAFVVLYGNVPARPAGAIDRAIELLDASGCDSVRSFCPVGKWHPAWMSKLDGDRVRTLVPGSIHRRQDLEPLFLHDGGVVAVSRSSLLRGEQTPDDPHAFFGNDRRGIEVESGETVEIDCPRDFHLAEAVLRSRQQRGEFKLAV
jgi:N-acylneuraminate cytidylyltransferase